MITSADGDQLYNILDDPSENLNIASENQEIVLELKNTLSQWKFGENRSLPISAVFKDPDLFGGEEDRIPWIEKAFSIHGILSSSPPNKSGSLKTAEIGNDLFSPNFH